VAFEKSTSKPLLVNEVIPVVIGIEDVLNVPKLATGAKKKKNDAGGVGPIASCSDEQAQM